MDKKREKEVTPLEILLVSLSVLVILYEVVMTILLLLNISLFSILGIILAIIIFGGGGGPVAYGYYRGHSFILWWV
jgi:hypothetical protein